MRPHLTLTSLAAIALAVTTHAQFGTEQSIPQEGPRGVEVMDMDNDQDNDLLIYSRAGLQLCINTNGLGALSTPVLVSSSAAMGHAVDVDGDDYLDVVGSAGLVSGISWFRNLGTFGFATANAIDPVANAELIASGDMDGDDDQDLVLALDDNTLRWSANLNGLGQFGSLQMIATEGGIVDVQVKDIDADGDLDVSWSTTMSGQSSWSENINGFGDLGAPQVLTSFGRGVHADLDGDGRLDLGTVNTIGDQVMWQRRTLELVTYGPAQVFDASIDAPEIMHAADLDGDGDNDIALTSAGTDEIVWYENTDGQGAFGPPQVVGSGVQDPMLLASGDLDGDGDLELFSASGYQNRVVRYDNLSNAGNMIVGRVFNDINNDGVFNGEDHGLYNWRVEAPGIGVTFTNHAGVYWFHASPGIYTVEAAEGTDWTFTTAASITATLDAPTYSSQGNDFGMAAVGVIHQLEATLTNSPTRCDLGIPYWVTVVNTGNQVDDIHLTLDLDDLSGYVMATTEPTIVGGTQNWVFEDVQPTHQRSVMVIVHLPGGEHLGEILHDALTAEAIHNGVNVYSGTHNNDPELVCAFDPNVKSVWPIGDSQAHLVPMDQTLTYTILFQNIGSAPAVDVTVTDPLDLDLDPATLQVTASSHPVHMAVGSDGVATFFFDGINLPDSVSDEAGSHGFVRFTVNALSGLPDMTPVHNHAEIEFDSNPAIVTNTVLNTLTHTVTGMEDPLAMGGASISVAPNPALDMATVYLGYGLEGRVQVTMMDEAGREVMRVIRNSSTLVLERGDTPAGIYLIRAVDEKGTEALTRLVWER